MRPSPWSAVSAAARSRIIGRSTSRSPTARWRGCTKPCCAADAASGIAESWPRAQEFALISAGVRDGPHRAPAALARTERRGDRPAFLHHCGVSRAWPRAAACCAISSRNKATCSSVVSASSSPSCTASCPTIICNRSRSCRRVGTDLIAQRAAHYRKALDALPEPHPVLEYAINRMEDLAPPISHLALCHRDFRTGNYMVDGNRPDRHPGFRVRRVGATLTRISAGSAPAAGASAPTTTKRAASAHVPPSMPAMPKAPGDRSMMRALRYWEAIAPIRWAIIALQQGERHASGQEPSLDLALTGLRAIECEYDLLSDLPKMKKEGLTPCCRDPGRRSPEDGPAGLARSRHRQTRRRGEIRGADGGPCRRHRRGRAQRWPCGGTPPL